MRSPVASLKTRTSVSSVVDSQRHFSNLQGSHGPGRSAQGRRPSHPAGRGLRHHRPQRRRQKLAGAHHQPAEPAHRRPGAGGRPRADPLNGDALRVARRDIGIIFQHFNLLSSRTVYGNVALPLELAGLPAGGDQGPRRAAAGPGRPERPARPLSGADQRRPEAARGHCARAGQPAQGAAVRRSDFGARPGNHALHPRPAEADQPRIRPDHRADHAPDAGHQAGGRPRGGDRRRPHRGAGR
jgi:hypothetical protein